MDDSESLAHKRSILEYWTLVEFFSPYALDNRLDGKLYYQKIYADKPSGQPLPWLNALPLEKDDPATPFAKGYHLYLGLFSIEETADRARHAFAKQPNEWQSVNWRSCGAPGSTTCFARLTITTHGTPLLGTLTLSTLPWAHGRLLDKGEESLTIEKYWKCVNRLLLRLREEFAASLPVRLVREPKEYATHLDQDAITKLTELLFEWAGYKPRGYPLALIEPIPGDLTVAAKEPQIEREQDVPILNSFYIQDLESAAISLNTQKGKPIDHYLGGKQKKRILLESDEGTKKLLRTVRPRRLPAGRWPDPLSHQQSLMQQFAISGALHSLKKGGLFSVNGPPGNRTD